MSFLKRHTLTAAVVCLLVAFALWSFYPGVPGQWVFLGLGGALLLLSLALNTGEARTAMGTRTARYGAGAAVMVLLALGIVVAANAISLRHSVRWDFTENKRNSVSPQTIQVLRTLKAPVNAIAFFRSDTPGKKTAEDLLTQYATYSRGKFTWRLEDTDRAPALARQYGVESYGTVVLEGGAAGQTRTEKVQDAEEEKLTNAIVKITRAGKRVVYVLKGHGEREIGSTDRAGFSQAKEQMEKANYEVKDLFLARDPKIPDDAAIVVVPSPKTDLFPAELAALDGYIAKAGKVFFMAAPFQAETTMKYLTKYGIVVDEDVVIELNPIGQLFGVGPLVPVVGQYEPHPITKDMGGVMTLFPLTRSVSVAKALPKGVQASPLAQTRPTRTCSRPARPPRIRTRRRGRSRWPWWRRWTRSPTRRRRATRPRSRRRRASWWWAPRTSPPTSSWGRRAIATSSSTSCPGSRRRRTSSRSAPRIRSRTRWC
jgi:gliding motility-associatede transport system auxiliary component